MLNLTVDPHGAGDYCTIGEALEAIPYGCEATIVVGEGTYNERQIGRASCRERV